MKNKQITRIIIQSLFVMLTTFIILEFYQYEEVPYMVKWISTIVLIVLNCTYNYWCGLKNGIKMSKEQDNCMAELRKENYNKV